MERGGSLDVIKHTGVCLVGTGECEEVLVTYAVRRNIGGYAKI